MGIENTNPLSGERKIYIHFKHLRDNHPAVKQKNIQITKTIVPTPLLSSKSKSNSQKPPHQPHRCQAKETPKSPTKNTKFIKYSTHVDETGKNML